MQVTKMTISKSMLSAYRPTIVERMICDCLNCGVSQSVIVLGHRSDQIKPSVEQTFQDIFVNYVINERYCDAKTGYSLMLASSPIKNADLTTFNGDVVFEPLIFRRFLDIDVPKILCGDCNVMLADPKVKVMQAIRWL